MSVRVSGLQRFLLVRVVLITLAVLVGLVVGLVLAWSLCLNFALRDETSYLLFGVAYGGVGGVTFVVTVSYAQQLVNHLGELANYLARGIHVSLFRLGVFVATVTFLVGYLSTFSAYLNKDLGDPGIEPDRAALEEVAERTLRVFGLDLESLKVFEGESLRVYSTGPAERSDLEGARPTRKKRKQPHRVEPASRDASGPLEPAVSEV